MYNGAMIIKKTPLLFTPGPLTTSQTTKEAMLRDLGSRDSEFIEIVRILRRKLLEIGGVADAGYEAVPMQGSGTMAVESVFASVVPPDGHVLVLINGAYGKRMAKICSVLKIGVTPAEWPEDSPPDPARISTLLDAHPEVTHVAVVHCETSTGMLNPVREIGEAVSGAGREYIVDAMSSFGGIPFDLAEFHIDYMISSANKCLEGVPGFAFVLARRDRLLEKEGCARSLSFDLVAQWRGLESGGQFRFTPPTHAILACHQAIREL
jgi:2-aminoethylphosphonate-pyruvate transaminase